MKKINKFIKREIKRGDYYKCPHCGIDFLNEIGLCSHANDLIMETRKYLLVLLDFIQRNQTKKAPEIGFLDKIKDFLFK